MSFLNEGIWLTEIAAYPGMTTVMEKEGEGRSLHPQALSEGSPLPAGLLSEALPG